MDIEAEDTESVRISDNGLNELYVCCPRCKDIIFAPNTAEYVNKKHSLPELPNSNSMQEINLEDFNQSWYVSDQFKFENIGFLNKIGSIQYLICASCEYGPLGFTDAPNNYYISCSKTNQLSQSETSVNNDIPPELSQFLQSISTPK